jgi:HD-like signal output (HDOD) protein
MVTTTFSEAELLEVAKALPAAPRLLIDLGKLIRSPDVDANEITALLRRDPALVSRLIRIANSAVYARAEPVASIEEALACIGFVEVHRLVGAVAAQQLAEEKLGLYGTGGEAMRQNSLFVAVIMEELAEVAGEEPRTSYTIGLLRSIGKMALNRLASDNPATVPFATSGFKSLDEWERDSWGTTNGEVAEKILVHWRLPHETVLSIRHHYQPGVRHNPMIHLLNLAAGSAEHRDYGMPGEEPYWQFKPDNFAKAGVDVTQFQIVTEAAHRKFNRLMRATS